MGQRFDCEERVSTLDTLAAECDAAYVALSDAEFKLANLKADYAKSLRELEGDVWRFERELERTQRNLRRYLGIES